MDEEWFFKFQKKDGKIVWKRNQKKIKNKVVITQENDSHEKLEIYGNFLGCFHCEMNKNLL